MTNIIGQLEKIPHKTIAFFSTTLLIIYLTLLPFLGNKIATYGIFILIPLIGFSLLGQRIAMISGSLTLLLNLIFHFVFHIGFAFSLNQLILPYLIIFATILLFGAYVDMSKEQSKLLKDLKQKDNEISELRQLIPICSYCKKIKDSDGYWTDVETYVKQLNQHSEFTHGICNSCYSQQSTE